MKLSGFALLLAVSATAYGQFPPFKAADGKPEDDAAANLYVVATDAAGLAVKGLTAADFALTQDGKPVPISSFEGASSGWSLLVVVDDMGTSLPAMVRVRQELREFLAAELKPEDRLAIVRTSGGSSSLLQLTSDRPALAAALENLDVHPQADPAGTHPPAFLTGTLQGLRTTLTALSSAAGGKKTIVLFSERMTLSGTLSKETTAATEAIATKCTELAQMAEASVYAIDLRPGNKHGSLIEIETGIAGVAAETGGRVLDGSADLPAAIGRVMQDIAGSYRLSFKSREDNRDFLTGTAVYRKLAVRPAKPGVLVRASGTVYGTQEPSHDNSLAVRLTPIVVHTPGAGSRLRLLIHTDASDISSVRDLKGQYTFLLNTDATIFGGSGQAGPELQYPGSAHMDEAAMAATRREGVSFSIQPPLSGTGLHRAEIRLTELATGRAGTGSEVFNAPVVTSELMTSSIVLAPAEENVPEDQAIREGTAVRRYSTNATFRYAYDLYNVTRDSQNHSTIEMQANVLRHGLQVAAIPPRTIRFDGKPATDAVTVAGVVRLNKQTPGHYVLSITSIDQLSAKPRQVTQFIDFWVVAEESVK